MFYYFGGKGNLVDRYPKPVHDRVIEPFCGSARYACKYFDRDVWINDKYPVITSIWRWIKHATPNDIRSLPVLKLGDDLNNYEQLSKPEKWLLGFCVRFGENLQVTKVRSADGVRNGLHTRVMKDNLLKIVGRIDHWKITNLSYEDMENCRGTWYVDPPYQGGSMGDRYKHGAKKIDFQHLAEWCRNRRGQVIVCEGGDADWLPFRPLTKQRPRKFRRDTYSELIWTKGCPKQGFDSILGDKG